ncbi:MAG: acetate--CoA ligase family protein [Betaproteobacteria bacterium]|nr:acetate--CoA ligase family protein [Betaproteobacteria bacterium]
MRPRSIAIVGMSARSGSIGQLILSSLKVNEFPGPIHLVGRSPEPIEGRPVLSSADQLPVGVDLAVFLLPAAAVGEALAACMRRKVGAAMIFASGFAETGDRTEQERISAMAREGGLALVGPNCLGFTNNVDGLMVHMLFARKARRFSQGDAPGVAFVGQSGGLLGHFQRAATARALPVSYVVSTGNEAGLDLADFTEYLVEDAPTRVIVLYAEQIRRPAQFLAACERARIAGKPVVLMHPGRGAGARHAASSHTGALVGDFGAMRTQVEHAGALFVDTLDELMDVTEFLVHYPKPPTKGPALLTASGAFCAIASDFADSIGLEIPRLSAHTREALKAALPFFGAPNNPLDVTAGNSAAIPALCKALLDEPNCGSLFVSFPLDGKPGMIRLQAILKGIEGSEKPLVTAALGDTSPIDEDIASLAKESGLIFSRSSDRCLRAIAMVTAYGQALERRRQEGEASVPAAITGLPILAKGTQPEWLGKKVLAAAGIRVPEGALARSMEEAAGVAARIGYPVVMKAQAAALAHKTEAGGVILGIGDEAALREAWTKLGENVGRAQPGVALDGVLVEAMAPRGLELMIGAKRDPAWGPVLLLGLGGIWVEALGDVRLVSPAASRRTIVEELLRLRSAKLLLGFRGSPAVDLDGIADAALAIGRLMLSVPAITEIDVNPLVAYAKGGGVMALDALIVTDGAVQ